MAAPPDDLAFEGRLRAARGGCGQALGDIFDAYRGYLLLIAQQELGGDLGPKAGASDLVQEALLDALKGFGAFRGDSGDELKGWLRRILLNNLGTFTRRYREAAKRQADREVPLAPGDSAAPGVEPSAGAGTPSQFAQAHERDDAVRRLLLQLPEDYRRVLQLRYEEGMTFEAIGEAMELTPNAARKLWVRAAKRFRDDWGSST